MSTSMPSLASSGTSLQPVTQVLRESGGQTGGAIAAVADASEVIRMSRNSPSRAVMEAGEHLGHHIRTQEHPGLDSQTIGPFGRSGALVAHYKSWASDSTVIRGHQHPYHYRIAVMLEPMEAQVWTEGHPAWMGVLAAGRFRIVRPGTNNQWRRNSGCDNVNIFIPKSTVANMPVSSIGTDDGGEDEVFQATPFIQDREVLDLARKLIGARSLVPQYTEQYCEGLIDALTSYLLSNYTDSPRGTRRSALDREVLHRLLDWLAGMHATPPSVSEMAQRCGLSESHFSREFALAVGVPPHKYLLNMRLNQAAERLYADPGPIIDVALDLGFSSASHFSRAFTQKFGVPPAAYRRKRQALEQAEAQADRLSA